MAEWLRGPLLPIFHEIVLGRDELLGLPFKPAAMAQIMEEHVSGRIDRSRWLWTVLSLALWSRHHLDRRQPLAKQAYKVVAA